MNWATDTTFSFVHWGAGAAARRCHRRQEHLFFLAGRSPTAIFGIAHVQLAITPGGEDAARAFYSGLLGLPELQKPESLRDRGGVWFQCGMQEIHCGIEEPVAATRRHPAFLIDNLETLKDALEAEGFATESDRQLPGYRRFYALDPFGNRLEFLERE